MLRSKSYATTSLRNIHKNLKLILKIFPKNIFLFARKALIHSIWISDVKVIELLVLDAIIETS